MSTIIRAGRAYWRLSERAWIQIKRATIPLLLVFGVGSVALWAIGLRTGNVAFQWAPAVYVWLLLISYAASLRRRW